MLSKCQAPRPIVDPMIEVRGLVKAFGVKPVLRGLVFQVDEGEFVAVVGPIGA